jgi:hypothetical protein
VRTPGGIRLLTIVAIVPEGPPNHTCREHAPQDASTPRRLSSGSGSASASASEAAT